MAIPIIPLLVAGAAAATGLYERQQQKAKSEEQARNAFLGQQLGSIPVEPVQQAQMSYARQLEDMGYKPGTPDYAAAQATGLAAIEKRRQALMSSGGGVSVTPARRTSPELEFYKRGLDERLAQSLAATERGFGEVVSSIEARQAGIDAAAREAAARAFYTQGAADIAAMNAVADQGIATGGMAATGIGPIEGVAAEAPAYLQAAGLTAADTSRRMAELSAEDLAWLASTTRGVSAARAGELRQQTDALRATAIREFLAAEEARVQRERQAAASAAAARQRELANLAGAEEQFLADLALKQADATAKAEAAWLAATMPYEAERLASTANVPAFSPGNTTYSLLTAAQSGKTEFTAAFNQNRAAYGRQFDDWARSQGYPVDAEGMWKEINKRSRAGR